MLQSVNNALALQGKARASGSALFNTLGVFGGFVGPYLIGALSNHGSFTCAGTQPASRSAMQLDHAQSSRSFAGTSVQHLLSMRGAACCFGAACICLHSLAQSMWGMLHSLKAMSHTAVGAPCTCWAPSTWSPRS